jgi:Tat protein secretion system quality control protein TatD with DNase activity
MDETYRFPEDKEIWASLLILEGEVKADALSTLSITYSGTEDSQYAIALAEEAKEIYFAAGFDGNEIEFAWIWGVLAESNAKLDRYNEALEAGLRYEKGYEHHFFPAYPQIRWEMIRWYLEAYRFEEAKAQFEMLHDRYKASL